MIRWFINLLKNLFGVSEPVEISDPVSTDPAPWPTAPLSNPLIIELVDLHNAERSTPLVSNDRLTYAAQNHAEWMAAHRMRHRGQNGSKPSDRIKVAGYNWTTYGENIAYGQHTPKEVMKTWIRSSDHLRNIKSNSFSEIGVGVAENSQGILYWCVTFGSRGFSSGVRYGSNADSEESTPTGLEI